MSSTLQLAMDTSWTAYYCLENNPGTTPTNPAFLFLTEVQSFNINPNPKYKQIAAAGNSLPYLIQLMSIRPECNVTLQITDLAILTNLVESEHAATIVFRHVTGGINVVMRGAYIANCIVKATNKENAYLVVSLDIVAMSVESTTTTPAGNYALTPKNSLVIPVSNVQLRNVGVMDSQTGSDVISDWQSFRLAIRKKFVRRIAPDGSTRALAYINTRFELAINRLELLNNVAQQQSDLLLGSEATLKVEVLSDPESWSATLSGARPEGKISVDGKTEDGENGDSKDSEVSYKYSALSIAYSSDGVSIVLPPPDASTNEVGLSEIFTEDWSDGTTEVIVGQPPAGSGNAVPAMIKQWTEIWQTVTVDTPPTMSQLANENWAYTPPTLTTELTESWGNSLPPSRWVYDNFEV